MNKYPRKCVIDTNVPITANKSLKPADIPENMLGCVLACVEAIEHIQKKGTLVMDAGDEIFTEYRRHLSLAGQPGVGDKFMKWVHDNRWNPQRVDQVTITRNDDDYDEFPVHQGLDTFDQSDRKFIAVANAHSEKPTILQATDSKWWGWKDALEAVGITVCFLCPQYIAEKYREKMGA